MKKLLKKLLNSTLCFQIVILFQKTHEKTLEFFGTETFETMKKLLKKGLVRKQIPQVEALQGKTQARAIALTPIIPDRFLVTNYGGFEVRI